jgi:hypothetical protein
LTGSLYKPNTPLLDKFQLLSELTVPVAEHQVTTTRLDDIQEISNVDFIKIDVQGSELNVLRNAKRSLSSAVLIQTEISYVESYIGQPMFADVDKFLRTNGFQFHDFAGQGGRSFKPLLNVHGSIQNPLTHTFRQKIWADAFYVKDWMMFDRLPISKLFALAALLHDLVQSYDMAYHALTFADRQSGNDFSLRYLRRLRDSGLCNIVTHAELNEIFIPVAMYQDLIPDADEGIAGSIRPKDITITIQSDLTLFVPGSLSHPITYSLLEKEDCFERETRFLASLLKPGMSVVDLDPGIGVFSLIAAKYIGTKGSVATAISNETDYSRLQSAIAVNDVTNVRLVSWPSDETLGTNDHSPNFHHSPDASSTTETITVMLGELFDHSGRPTIDFLRIGNSDAALRIFSYAQPYLNAHSPLLMFPTTGDRGDFFSIRRCLETMGYRIFRLIGNGDFLIPAESAQQLDSLESNLFAAKHDQVMHLADIGLLTISNERFQPDAGISEIAIGMMIELPFAAYFGISADDIAASDIAEALIAFAAYRLVPAHVDTKIAWLRSAQFKLNDVTRTTQSATVLSTGIAVLLSLGLRTDAIRLLTRLIDLINTNNCGIEQPFFPACKRYESISPAGLDSEWFSCAAIEQLLLCHPSEVRHESSNRLYLRELAKSQFASSEICRRWILQSYCEGARLENALQHIRAHHTHLNPSIWTISELKRLANVII